MPVNVNHGSVHFGYGLHPIEAFTKYFDSMRLQAVRQGVILQRPEFESGANILVGRQSVMAYINHNRWVAECPTCNGAELVWIDIPVFMCMSCWNGAIGHRWRRVIVPDTDKILALHSVLEQRHNPANRNWFPHESVQDLMDENKDHKVGESVEAGE